MKLCKDCKWFDGGICCTHEKATSIDIVTGKKSFMTCIVFRTGHIFRNYCGLEGHLWEQRTEIVVDIPKKSILKRLFGGV